MAASRKKPEARRVAKTARKTVEMTNKHVAKYLGVEGPKKSMPRRKKAR